MLHENLMMCRCAVTTTHTETKTQSCLDICLQELFKLHVKMIAIAQPKSEGGQ